MFPVQTLENVHLGYFSAFPFRFFDANFSAFQKIFSKKVGIG